ncbi:unnamed protein product [Rhodiola kirilowii]
MEKEPLLAYHSPRWNLHIPHHLPPLCPLPEEGEVSLPMPLTPHELKDRLIFGPCSPCASELASSSSLFDALTLTTQIPNSGSETIVVEHDLPHTPFQSQQSPSWTLYDTKFKSPWHKSNLHRSKTAPAMAVINDFVKPVPKPQSSSQSVVKQAFALLIVYLALGVAIYSFNKNDFVAKETHPVVDALYFCIVTMCTIGYGDITPNSTATKLFSIMFVLVGFGFIDILMSGMVSYVLDLQENYLLKTVKGDRGDRDAAGSLLIDVKKGRMRIRMKVALALGVVVLCIAVGVGVMHFVENLGWLDSFYLSVMSVTTVGYGDRAFESMTGRIFASIWLLVSTLAVARAFLYLAEARVDKRQRKMAKWVLAHDMTVSEFLAADIDHNGFVSKSEYVIYKLKEMGKVGEKDILEICKQFERLDSGNCGKITLADLMETHS